MAEKTFAIETGPLSEDARPGDSLAVNGVCLTAIEVVSGGVTVEAVTETLEKTNLGGLTVGSKVNLERPLQAGGRLHGHMVQGHVDAATRVLRVKALQESKLIEFALNDEIAPFIVGRGSVAVDGVSLTVARLDKRAFTVSAIGFTLSHTTLGLYRGGEVVNVETDIIGKYVVAALQRTSGAASEITEDKLRTWGY